MTPQELFHGAPIVRVRVPTSEIPGWTDQRLDDRSDTHIPDIWDARRLKRIELAGHLDDGANWLGRAFWIVVGMGAFYALTAWALHLWTR